MRYTVDIPANQPKFSKDYGDFTLIRSAEASFAYIADTLDFPVQLPDGLSPSIWNDCDIIRFSERLARNELDVLRFDGVNIGWILRNNSASLRLLQVMNGMPVTF